MNIATKMKKNHKQSSSSTCAGDSQKRDIAIIGMSCRFPDAPDCDTFWRNLALGRNSIKEIPKERWENAEYYSPKHDETNKSVSKWCGLLAGVDRFDNQFFNISPREANQMDPQQRLLLEETWRCIEESGISLAELQKQKTSVYVGVMAVDYRQEAVADHIETDSYACLGSYEAILANRLSYTFGFTGISMPVNVACASSLMAIHQAKQSLLAGESDYAIVAGINLNLHPWKYLSFSKSRMLSPTGQCRTFDQEADGYVPGEGVGVILLKRLVDADAKGCHIHGIIKGSAVNHSGHTVSITAPKVEAQMAVILSAYRDAALNPESITYVEAHGTGTSLGDPIEVEALTKAFRQFTSKQQYCKIGSVKTNIGHLEGAAGIAGLIKVLLMMRERKIPPSLNINTVNPMINFRASPFEVATALSPWETGANPLPRRAGISSFGFGGVNSHIVLEEFQRELNPSRKEETIVLPFLLSARCRESLQELIDRWREFLLGPNADDQAYQDMVFTLMHARECMPFRIGTAVATKEQLIEFLKCENPNIVVAPKAKWWLLIGDMPYTGWQKEVMQSFPLIEEKLKRVIKDLEVKGSLGINLREIKSAGWPEELRESYSLIVSYAILATLTEHGLAIECIAAHGQGLLLGLMLAGMITVADGLTVLTGKNAIRNLELKRPQIPFYNGVNGQTLMPYHFSEAYLEALLGNFDFNLQWVDQDLKPKGQVKPQAEGVQSYYVEQARLLNQNQYTFKKYLEEWAKIIQKSSGSNLDQMLNDDNLLTPNRESGQRERLLLLLVIMDSLRKLNRKWDLSEPKMIKDDRLYEILDLIGDEVLTPQLTVEIFMAPSSDYRKYARQLNERQHLINPKHPYPLLLGMSQHLHEIEAIPTWIETLENIDFVPPPGLNGIVWGKTALEESQCIAIRDFQPGALAQWLLRLWLNGIDIAYHRLYAQAQFRRLSLPTYRFESKPFWLPKGKDAKRALVEKIVGEKEVLAPIDFDQDRADFKEYYGSDTIVNDYRINGKNLLAGAEMISLMAEGDQTVENGISNDSITLRNITIIKNAEVPKKSSISVIREKRADRILIRLEADLLAEGTLTKETMSSAERFFEVDGLLDETEYHDEVIKDIYKVFEAEGYHYEKSFKVIRGVLKEGTCYCFLLREDEIEATRKISPRLLEGIFQCALFTCLAEGRIAGGEKCYLPAAVNRMDVFGAWSGKCVAIINSDNITIQNETLIVDIDVINGAGKKLAQIQRLRLKKISPETKSKCFYFVPAWVEKTHEANLERLANRYCVISADEAEAWQDLIQRADRYYQRVFLLGAAGNGVEFAGELERIIASVEERIEWDLYYLDAFENKPEQIGSSQQFEAIQNQAEKKLFHIIRLINRRQWKYQINFVIPTRDLWVVAPGDRGEGFYYGGIAGLIRTAALENNRTTFKMADFGGEDFENLDVTKYLFEEAAGEDRVSIVAIREGQRYVYSARNIQPEERGCPAVVHDGMTLVITGGMGGIGVQLLEYLTGKNKCNIALLGRSELSGPKEEILNQLRKTGNNFCYFRCDISDGNSLQAAVREIKDQFGSVDGVFHLAGTIEDRLIVNKEWDAYARVGSAKTSGLINLHQAFNQEPLRFFIAFSSIVAVLGNEGQADYAAANSFMDCFMHYRRRADYPGTSLAINWTLCHDGGMGLGEPVVNHFKAKSGVIASRWAFPKLEALITGDYPQVMVAGDLQAIQASFRKTNPGGMIDGIQ